MNTEDMRRRYAGGESLQQVADAAGIALSAVHRRLAPLGITRPPGRPAKVVNEAAVLALAAGGMGQRGIAAKLGISRRQVAKALQR